ncbi:MAG: hypothetical protein JWP02_3722, partial [Acidimicrobiales bacterium]|nr:hypothetical protein [Acidimicrobiales bacterium]
DLPPPGHADTRPQWHEAAFYTLDVTPAVFTKGAGS